METTEIMQMLAVLAKSEGLYVRIPRDDETENPDRSELLKEGESELACSTPTSADGTSSVTAAETSSVTSVETMVAFKKIFERIPLPDSARLPIEIIGGVVGTIFDAVDAKSFAAAFGGNSAAAGGGSSAAAGGGTSEAAGGGTSEITLEAGSTVTGGGSSVAAGGSTSVVAGGESSAAAGGGSSAGSGGTSGSLWSAVGGFAWNAASRLVRSVVGNYAVTARVQLVPVHDLVLNFRDPHRERLARKIRQIMNDHSVLNLSILADRIQQDTALVRSIILQHLIEYLVEDMSLNVIVSTRDASDNS